MGDEARHPHREGHVLITGDSSLITRIGRGALGLAMKADLEGRLERTQVRMPARVASNPGEKPGHRKPKVSDATYIDVGLGGPKPRPKGVGDGPAG